MKIVCFDFDDVIPKSNTVAKLTRLFGNKIKILGFEIEFLEDNMNPKKFFRVVEEIVANGKGIEFERVKHFMLRFGLNRGVKEVLKKLKKNGHKIVIVSANDETFIKEYIKKHGIADYIDHIYASRLGVKNGVLTGKIYGDVIKTEKTGVVKKIERMYKVKKKDIIYIGDGLTDLPIMKLAGRGILFCPNELTKAEVFTDKKLKEKIDNNQLFIVGKKDIKEILNFIK